VKLFWDTNLFIYLWESGPQSTLAEALAQWSIRENHEIVTSTLSLGEILVQPFRQGREDRVRAYEAAFAAMTLVDLTPRVAHQFARLRAQYPDLRPPDAVQLASALHTQADAFITNDHRLSRYDISSPMKRIPLAEWEQLRA